MDIAGVIIPPEEEQLEYAGIVTTSWTHVALYFYQDYS